MIGHSLCLCSILVAVLLLDRTNFRLKFSWVCWYLYPSNGSPSGVQEVAISGSISPPARSISYSYAHRLSGTSPIPGHWHNLRCVPLASHQFLCTLLALSPLPSPHLVPLTPPVSLLSPLRGSIQQQMETDIDVHSQTLYGAQELLWKSLGKH